jgi:hypothetical protein
VRFHLFVLFTLIPFFVGSCLILPNFEENPQEQCKLVTKSWTLEIHELGREIDCVGQCGDFVKGVVECGNSEDCIKFIAVVSVGWTVVATSVVGVGNSVHWIEKNGRCKDSAIQTSIDQLYSKTVDLGGFVFESGKDLADWIKFKK